jgi:hypothetical protein
VLPVADLLHHGAAAMPAQRHRAQLYSDHSGAVIHLKLSRKKRNKIRNKSNNTGKLYGQPSLMTYHIKKDDRCNLTTRLFIPSQLT